MTRIVIIAGEASGDQLGAGIIREVLQQRPDVQFEGVTGPQMVAAGCRSWFSCDRLAVMGLVEVLQHLRDILSARREVLQRILSDPPDLVIGIDAPDFNLPVEKKLRAAGIPVIHYVCPSVWAWREGRVKNIRAAADHVLCLLPFEPAFLEKHQVSAEFVGHPLADEIPQPPEQGVCREALGLSDNERSGAVVAILPGSRMGEVGKLGEVFAATAARLQAQRPELTFVAAFANQPTRERFLEIWQQHVDAPLECYDGRMREVLGAADAVLLASGTVTLEAMLCGCPMVVAYKLAPLSYWIARLFRLMKVEHFALPNLLAGRALVPECIQHEANPERLSAELLSLLNSADKNQALKNEFAQLQGVLRQSASEKSAAAALRFTAGG